MSPELNRRLVEQAAARMREHYEELAQLDRVIGDGDHGLNMRSGIETVIDNIGCLPFESLPDLLVEIGRLMLSSVGGAAGPLYGTFLTSLGKSLTADPSIDDFRLALCQAVEAVARLGKSEPGQKTLLDVLCTVEKHIRETEVLEPALIRDIAMDAASRTIPMRAYRGRAAFLGERSIGHMDPGARSASLFVVAVCDTLAGVH